MPTEGGSRWLVAESHSCSTGYPLTQGHRRDIKPTWQKNPGPSVACIWQLDQKTGTGYNSHRGYGIRRCTY